MHSYFALIFPNSRIISNMPKNFKGTNTKAVAARERRSAAESERLAQKQKEEDDEFWRDDDKHVAKKQQRKVLVNGLSICVDNIDICNTTILEVIILRTS